LFGSVPIGAHRAAKPAPQAAMEAAPNQALMGSREVGGEADPVFGGAGCCCGCVNSGSVHAIQRCGEYVGYAEPGCYAYIPGLHTQTEVDIRCRQFKVRTDCKSADSVQLMVEVAVQYGIDKDRLQNAVFKTNAPEELISSSVQNIVRSAVTTLELDETYSNKETLSKNVLATIARDMDPKGYKILNCLVTDIRPDAGVLRSMNQINASKNQREAAVQQGEAQKILQVKAAEADAESKYLSGQGMARMRVEMAKGFKQSMDAMASGGLTPQEAMNMMITTQYVDTIADFAKNSSKNAVMMPMDDPKKDMEAKVRDGFIAASRLGLH